MRDVSKRFLLWILVVFLSVIVLTIPFCVGFISATNEVGFVLKLVLGTVTLCIADVKSYLQQKVIN